MGPLSLTVSLTVNGQRHTLALAPDTPLLWVLRDALDHPVQRTWIEEDVPQCGYCQPGMVMAAAFGRSE